MHRNIPSLASLILPLALWAPSVHAQTGFTSDIDHLDKRLEYLALDFEKERIKNNIPGLALAVVKDDEIIFAQGFGLADRENGRKVTPETAFAIGSTSKAFTSALIAALVDEGKMDWDAPITQYLPFFKLSLDTDDKDAQATIRDLLCHRTGFTRMGMLWAAGLTSVDEILRTATLAEPWDGFRKKFYYNNVMYLAAGEASAKMADTTWGELLRTRLLDPLHMETTNITLKEAHNNPHMALGYSWQPDLKTHVREQMRDLICIEPAGAINSNVIEMANWVRLQLGRGTFEGNRLVSEEALCETWKDNIAVAGPVKYGMGWMITQYDGQVALQHGGNIDGFAAGVALLPESNIGYVMLSNISNAGVLQSPTSTIVWDALLKEFEDRDTEELLDSTHFDDFLGVFIGNFASFKDADFSVTAEEGALFVDIPGQANVELLPEDKEGKRGLKLAPTTQVRFVRNDEGNIDLMELHEGSATFELFRKGYTPPLDLPLEELEIYFGKYKNPSSDEPLTVKLQNGHLAVDVPGQMIFELNLPNDEGAWTFRAIPGISVKFEMDDEGQVIAAIQNQGGKDTRCERLSGSEISGLPSMDDLDQLRHLKDRTAAFAKNETLRRQASVRFIHSGIEGTLDEVETENGRFYQHVVMGKFGYTKIGFDGTKGWVNSAFDTDEEPEGIMLDQLKLTLPTIYFKDWKSQFDKARVLRSSAIDGVEHWEVHLTKGSLPQIAISLNKETGDITRINTTMVGKSGERVPMTTHLSDYRDVNGMRLPYRIKTESEASGATVIQYESLEANVDVPETLFQPRK